VAAGSGVTAGPGGTTTGPARAALSVVASGLANPRQLSVSSSGVVYVAEAGNGGQSACTKPTSGGRGICVGPTGSIGRISGGRAVPVVSGLPSVSSAGGANASGPADVVVSGSTVGFVIQDTDIGPSGANQFGTLGRALGRLVVTDTAGKQLRVSADFGRYEATHNPDGGAGASAASAIESDPYGLVAYRGGYAVVDAAGNDLLWVDSKGAVHLLAVFPTQTAKSALANGASAPVAAQSVPTSVAVGPDGALYVGELTGAPFKVGSARVWRVVPGSAPTVYASGFTSISGIAFDRSGRLLVLEINRLGLSQPTGDGELIRVNADRSRTVLVSRGLRSPTGVAVGPDGSIYISNYGSSPSTGAAPHGEILRLALA
jgi:sugar lactone lactonase YvrE